MIIQLSIRLNNDNAYLINWTSLTERLVRDRKQETSTSLQMSSNELRLPFRGEIKDLRNLNLGIYTFTSSVKPFNFSKDNISCVAHSIFVFFRIFPLLINTFSRRSHTQSHVYYTFLEAPYLNLCVVELVKDCIIGNYSQDR